jgi:hypothetical protein
MTDSKSKAPNDRHPYAWSRWVALRDRSVPACGPAEALALQELRARAFNILTGSSCR